MEKRTFKDLVAGYTLYTVYPNLYEIEEDVIVEIDNGCGRTKSIVLEDGNMYINRPFGCQSKKNQYGYAVFIDKDLAVKCLNKIINCDISKMKREISMMKHRIDNITKKRESLNI